jgi:hypothetical protein
MRMTIKLTNAAWKQALDALPAPCRDVYFSPEYYSMHVANSEGVALCSLLQEGNASLLVPGLRVAIDGQPGLFDLQTCNGYGGPVASPAADASFLVRAWEMWRSAMAAEGIVAAFFRLHPLLDNARWLAPEVDLVPNRETVYIDLTIGLEAVWRAADTRHRNMVNRARRSGTQVRWDVPLDWDDFPDFYAAAMERLNAPSSLRFSRAYFTVLRTLPGVALAAIRDVEGLVAASIFLYSSQWSHYHLSARRADAPNYAMNCLLQAGMEQAVTQGAIGMHLGGGVTPSPSDPLLRFKQSLGGRKARFDVARVVTDPVQFSRLIEAWIAQTGLQPGWLLGYRQPVFSAETA